MQMPDCHFTFIYSNVNIYITIQWISIIDLAHLDQWHNNIVAIRFLVFVLISYVFCSMESLRFHYILQLWYNSWHCCYDWYNSTLWACVWMTQSWCCSIENLVALNRRLQTYSAMLGADLGFPKMFGTMMRKQWSKRIKRFNFSIHCKFKSMNYKLNGWLLWQHTEYDPHTQVTTGIIPSVWSWIYSVYTLVCVTCS